MNTKTSGQSLHDPDAEIRRQAARAMGSARTERKKTASVENGKKGGAHAFTEETREKLRAAQAARRERERQEKATLGPIPPAVPKRKTGRPKKQTEGDASA